MSRPLRFSFARRPRLKRTYSKQIKVCKNLSAITAILRLQTLQFNRRA
jgi:hypothetical protein